MQLSEFSLSIGVLAICSGALVSGEFTVRELGATFKRNGFKEIPTWLCLTYYSFFEVIEEFWCEQGHIYGCNATCDEFKDFRVKMECAKHVYEGNGFGAWPILQKRCTEPRDYNCGTFDGPGVSLDELSHHNEEEDDSLTLDDSSEPTTALPDYLQRTGPSTVQPQHLNRPEQSTAPPNILKKPKRGTRSPLDFFTSAPSTAPPQNLLRPASSTTSPQDLPRPVPSTIYGQDFRTPVPSTVATSQNLNGHRSSTATTQNLYRPAPSTASPQHVLRPAPSFALPHGDHIPADDCSDSMPEEDDYFIERRAELLKEFDEEERKFLESSLEEGSNFQISSFEPSEPIITRQNVRQTMSRVRGFAMPHETSHAATRLATSFLGLWR